MATTTPFPTPAGPFTADPQTTATDALPAAPTELAPDALALLDHTTHPRTIRPGLALRGTYLAFGDGDDMRLLPLGEQITHIGRGADAQVRLEEHRISRDHAILVRHVHGFRLLDNRSTNGTYVNGRRVVATNVSDGDVIRLGPVVMRFFEVR